jgi:hypothetical protein
MICAPRAQPAGNTLPDVVTIATQQRRNHDGQGYAAYGLRLLGLGISSDASPAWEPWTVTQQVEAGSQLAGEEMRVWGDRALIPMPELGRVTVDRNRREIVFTTIRPLAAEAVLHPGLVPVAAVVNWWNGRACLHASAVVSPVDRRVWALVADRGGGKSTTAALLAKRGYGLFTDDMLIADGTHCFAGPASVDLRTDASEALGGRNIGRIGQRERWRKTLPRVTLEAPLAGLIELAWSEGEPGLETLDFARRLELVGQHASMSMEAQQLLALASLPAVRFARPRSLDRAEEGIGLLEQVLGPPSTPR